jgi:hypothetical protein
MWHFLLYLIPINYLNLFSRPSNVSSLVLNFSYLSKDDLDKDGYWVFSLYPYVVKTKMT